MKKIFAIIALVLGLQVSFAQLSRYEFASLGYQYQNQSFVEVGGKLVFFHGNDDLLYRIGASALLGSVNILIILIISLALLNLLLNTSLRNLVLAL